MDIKQLERKTLSESGSDQNIISVSSEYVAIAEGSTISVQCLDVTKRELELIGHTHTITQLHFSASNILLSTSSDSLLSWNLSEARAAINAGKKPLPVYVGVGLGSAAFIATITNIIILAVKCDIMILDTAAGTTRFLEGHAADVVYCHMVNSTRIITLSSDNCLKVWCLLEKRAITQFQLLSSAPFTSAYFDIDTLYLGSADGMLHVYEPNSGTRLKRINVENYLPNLDTSPSPEGDDNVIYAQPQSKFLTQNESYSPADGSVVNNSVLAIFKVVNKSGQNMTECISTFGTEAPVLEMNIENVLIIVLTSGIVQLNSLSLQLLTSISFLHNAPSLPFAYSVQCFLLASNPVLAYADLFNTELTVLELRKLSSNQESNVSMVQKCLLTTTTPLLNLSQWKKPVETAPVIKGTEKKKSKAKSSGYTTKPRQQMFKPVTNSKTKKTEVKKAPKKDPYVYPSSECRPKFEKNKLAVSDRLSPVQALAYSRESDMIAVGLADYSGVVLRLPSGSKSVPLVGHKGPLTSIKWSTLASHVITTAADKSCKVWDVTSGYMIIDVKYRDGNTKNCEKIEFKKDTVGGHFYYIDKFILLAHSNELLLYKHHVEKPKNSKRVLGRYQNICTSALSHTITALSCCNSFYSTIVVCGLSDKSISIYDYNQEVEAMRIPDAHSRAPHHVTTVDGSKYVPHSSETHNLIMSCSVQDDVKLWDVRSGQCVNCFSKPNRVASVPSVSTCVRYLAIPGDDHAVHLFDIRGGGPVSKIQTDNVLTTVFSPKYPQLAVGSTAGVVTFYNDR